MNVSRSKTLQTGQWALGALYPTIIISSLLLAWSSFHWLLFSTVPVHVEVWWLKSGLKDTGEGLCSGDPILPQHDGVSIRHLPHFLPTNSSKACKRKPIKQVSFQWEGNSFPCFALQHDVMLATWLENIFAQRWLNGLKKHGWAPPSKVDYT